MKVVGILMLIVLIAMAGCASDGTKKAGAAANRIDDLGEKMLAGDQLIEDTVSALNAMVEKPEGDLTAMFNTYRNDLSRLEDVAKKVGSRADAVWDQKDEYFEQWEKSLDEINNEEFKNIAEERKKLVLAAFGRVQKSLDDTSASFEPLLKNLQDIRTMLTNDLNATGVRAIAPIATQITDQSAKTRKDIARTHTDLGNLARTITPTAQKK